MNGRQTRRGNCVLGAQIKQQFSSIFVQEAICDEPVNFLVDGIDLSAPLYAVRDAVAVNKSTTFSLVISVWRLLGRVNVAAAFVTKNSLSFSRKFFSRLLAVSIPAEAGTTKIMLNSVITEYPIGLRS